MPGCSQSKTLHYEAFLQIASPTLSELWTSTSLVVKVRIFLSYSASWSSIACMEDDLLLRQFASIAREIIDTSFVQAVQILSDSRTASGYHLAPWGTWALNRPPRSASRPQSLPKATQLSRSEVVSIPYVYRREFMFCLSIILILSLHRFNILEMPDFLEDDPNESHLQGSMEHETLKAMHIPWMHEAMRMV